MSDPKVPGVKAYGGAAAGWGALGAVARALRGQMAMVRETRALLQTNKPDGFDCPGCAWPDPLHTSSFEFCENGAKAVSWEATAKRTTPKFFAKHSVAELWEWTDYALEGEGRITHPMAYDAETDHYVPISWEEAAHRIGEVMQALPDPNQAEFYTSGRASNEASFLYQLFARAYGTNNFPDCSNMCHEATSVGLPLSIGVGKATVTLEDFDACDALFSFGHNPGTNHPRMLATLREIARRGARIVAVNPLPERGLERFTSPQDAVEMLTGGSTRIASSYYLVRVGGDLAVLKGMMKWLLEADAEDLARGGPGLLDRDFIAAHTVGLDALAADLKATSWGAIVTESGLSREDIAQMGEVYAKAERVIMSYGVGFTQHLRGTENVQQMANLLLLRGNIGKRGAGIAPIRGHSNVQGNRTVGITEKPNAALLEGIQRSYGFTPPSAHGHNAVEALKAIHEGRSKAFFALGGNYAVAMPDPQTAFEAMAKLELAVHIGTKLNRSHLIRAKRSFILPCLGRTELDIQNTGPQSVTIEDSVSMVHASQGLLSPASEHLRSEVSIVGLLARASMPDSKIDWEGMVDDYDLIRAGIESVFPIFERFNERIRNPGGFHLDNAAEQRIWHTANGKANFLVASEIKEDLGGAGGEPTLRLTTIRSHDQYNTTIYGLNDRYRGITGRRDVVFVNREDLTAQGLKHGDLIDVIAVPVEGPADLLIEERAVRGYTALAYDISRGSVAMYYPEGNVLVSLEHQDPHSGQPTYKAVPVRLQASNAVPANAAA